jgi:hypothetical protein
LGVSIDFLCHLAAVFPLWAVRMVVALAYLLEGATNEKIKSIALCF